MKALTAIALVAALGGRAWAQADDAATDTTTTDATAEAAADALAAEAEAADIPEADKIRTPDSPAFVILGLSPTEIQKPTTPKELAIALSAFVDDDNQVNVPTNLAIEVAPYWWMHHDDLTFDDYLDTSPAQLWRNLSVSLGSSGVEGSDQRGLGVGFRSQLGWGGPELAACKALDTDLQAMADASALGLDKDTMNALHDEHAADFDAITLAMKEAIVADDDEGAAAKVKEIDARFADPDDPMHTAVVERIASARAQLAAGTVFTARMEDVRVACAAAATTRQNVIAIAGALAWTFPTTTAEDGDFGSQAYWLTFARTVKQRSSILALARATFDEAQVGWDGFVDVGGRALTARDRYGASLEAVVRRQIKGANKDDFGTQIRLAVQAEYEVRDDTWVSVTIGKQFAAADAGSLFSLANVSWGFGDPKPKIAAPQ